MKISTKGRYAIRLMIDLAEHKSGEYIPLMDVAKRQGNEYLPRYLRTLDFSISFAIKRTEKIPEKTRCYD